MNRGELRLAAQKRIRDTDGIRTTETEINHYIDDGYNDLAERSGAVTRTTNLTCPPGEHYIALPSDCLYPIVLRDVTTGDPIDFVDWPYIDKHDRVFIRRVGQKPHVAAMWGLGELLIYKAYQDGGTMEIIMAVVPSAFTADNQEPDLPEQHHQALIHYVHGRVLLKDAHGDLAGPRLGKAKRQMATYQALAGGLEKWAMDRHGVMRITTYGENLRIHDLEHFPELRESWVGPTP